MKIVEVDCFDRWRTEARLLLQAQIPPNQVSWVSDKQKQLIFSDSVDISHRANKSRIKVPGEFLALARAAACYRDDSRWSLLYSVLWRLNCGEPQLLHISTDTEVRKLKHMHQAVHRDVHKMHAFVRFKLKQLDNQEWYISWFEPSHLIVAYTADFFVKRFNTMNWSILTPDACAHWNQQKFTVTDGVHKGEFNKQIIEDKMDDYWRQYYRHIFNPARLKTQAMQNEMPKKYWHNLPEAELIRDLSQHSGQRTTAMLNNKETDANRLRDKSKRLRQQQDAIREKNL